MASVLNQTALHELSDQISGTILRPDDAEYEESRRGWNLNINQFPALIVIVNDVQDIVASVRYASAHNLGVSVQLTGHGIKSPADDNLLIVTKQLKGVTVDVAARTARTEGGTIWQEVLDAATPHGLAPLLGTSPHVGVVGYTLGGGIGWLGRQYGLAADSVHAIDVVTPDGEFHHTTPTQDGDLFWGLLGGGGNFGVVTAIEFALYPVATLYGGTLTYPGTTAKEALHFYREWLKGVPEALTSSIAIIKYPEMPQLPDTMRGKIFVLLRAAYAGEATKGEELLQAWLDWQAPLSNTFRSMPFAEAATITNDSVAPVPLYTTSDMLGELSDAAIELIVLYATNPQSPVILSELRHAGGAIARADGNANAVSNRDAAFYLTIGGPTFTPESRKAMEEYIPLYKRELHPYLHGGIYMNLTNGDEARARVKDAYTPEKYERLLALKAKVDPKNLFRFGVPLEG